MNVDTAQEAPLEVAADSTAAARSHIYALFAQALAFPQADIGAALESGELSRMLAQAAGALPYRYTFVSPTPMDAREMGRLYTSLFEAISGKPRVSLLEQRHEGAPPEQQLWEELLRFYRYFGLDFSTDGARERPDHLQVELEFMHYLSFLEAGAGDEHPGLRRGQQDFLERHLARWLPGLRVALLDTGDAAPYDTLIDALVRFVGADAAYLGCRQAGPEPPL